MAKRIQIRRDTAANWTSSNPILAQGEFGYETNTKKFKIGDGITAWSSLSYFTSGGVAALVDLTDVDDANIAIGKILQVGADGVTHEYVDMPAGGLDKTFQTLTEAATITFDAATSVNGSVTLTASRIGGNITNAVVGEVHCWKITQGGAGGYAMTWGNQYKFSGGVLPILSATVGAVDLLFFLAVSTSEFHFINANFDVKTP
jgi:hypothetical protein